MDEVEFNLNFVHHLRSIHRMIPCFPPIKLVKASQPVVATDDALKLKSINSNLSIPLWNLEDYPQNFKFPQV
jgi:hypothetical protein